MRPVFRAAIFIVLATVFVIFSKNDISRPGATTPPARSAEVIAPTQQPERGNPVAAGDLYARNAMFEFAVYLPQDLPIDTASFLKNAIAEKYTSLQFVPTNEIPTANRATCQIESATIAEYKVPSADRLKRLSHGLSDTDVQALLAAKRVIVLDFHAPHAEALVALKQAHALMLDLATETKGYLWDEASRVVYSRDAWKARRVEPWKDTLPDLTSHIEVHYYPSGEFNRLITVGMEKFGLPDICVEDCTRSDSDSMCNVINLVCQTMAETGRIGTAGLLNVEVAALKNTPLRERLLKSYRDHATGKAAIRLNSVPLQDGDAKNRLLEINFPGNLGDGIQQRQASLIQQIFGSTDSIKYIKQNDSELLAAKARAKEKIKTEFKLWKAGLPIGEQIMVKAPFNTPADGVEWMWIEVTQWKDNGAVEGILANDPFDIPTLKSGAKVRVTQDSLFDYIHTFADGHTEGNETGKVIERMEGRTK